MLQPRRRANVLGARLFSKKHFVPQRVRYPWKVEATSHAWPLLHQEMIAHFRTRTLRKTTAPLASSPWRRYSSTMQILDHGGVPAVIWKHGPDRRVILDKEHIYNLAFDEEHGHLSHLFKARLFQVRAGNWIEECVVSSVKTHVVNREVYFVRLARHVPGIVTEVEIPVTLVSLFGCPAALAGGHVDLAMATVKCECIGDEIPPPFLVDCSKLRLDQPYGRITLRDMLPLLPADGKTRFHRDYDLDATEVVHAYEPRSVVEKPLPEGWEDPNFFHHGGHKVHLTYGGFWPKQ